MSQVLTDSANLRAAVRTVRMGKDRAFMLSVLLPGGSVGEDALAKAAESGDGLAAAYQRHAAGEGGAARRAGHEGRH